MNTLEPILFYLFSLTAIVSALIVVTNKRPTYSVLALTLTMLALSALFILLKAYFVAVIQILIYAGAILVLFLFVIMLLGVDNVEKPVFKAGFLKSAQIKKAVQFLLVFVFLIQLLLPVIALKLNSSVDSPSGTTEAIGTLLFGRYLLPFELVSGILLIGIFGVVTLAHEEKRKS